MAKKGKPYTCRASAEFSLWYTGPNANGKEVGLSAGRLKTHLMTAWEYVMFSFQLTGILMPAAEIGHKLPLGGVRNRRNNYMNNSEEALYQFFGGYFHQDWRLDDPTWQSVAHRFLSESVPADSVLVAAGLERLLTSSISDEALCDVVQKLGCYYWAGSPAEMRTWISQVVSALHSIGA